MSFRQTPYAQIARVIFRSLGLQDARWLYFAMACVAVITVAGAAMLLISAPMRWPVRWCLFMVGLVCFLRNSAELFESGPLNALIVSRTAMHTVAALIFTIMGWLITRLIANDGSPLLALRYLRQAFAAWILANAWALLLPYPESVTLIVAAIVWGTLLFVPLILQDWAAVRAPQAERALVIFLAGMLVPMSAWAALQWLQLPVWLLALVSVGACLSLLRVRWQRLPGFAQAFSMGRLA